MWFSNRIAKLRCSTAAITLTTERFRQLNENKPALSVIVDVLFQHCLCRTAGAREEIQLETLREPPHLVIRVVAKIKLCTVGRHDQTRSGQARQAPGKLPKREDR